MPRVLKRGLKCSVKKTLFDDEAVLRAPPEELAVAGEPSLDYGFFDRVCI